MGFRELILKLTAGQSRDAPIAKKGFDSEEEIIGEIELTEYGIFTVVNFIATLVQQIVWHTYKDDARFKGYEWYSLNVRPNKNQSAAEFWHEIASELLLHGEALVFEYGDQRIIADHFQANKGDSVQERTFSDVGRGLFRRASTLRMRDVLYFRYTNSGAKAAVSKLCEEYGKLMKSASEEYILSAGGRGLVYIDANQTGTDAERAAEMKMLSERFKVFLKNKNAILPLKNGYKYEDVSKDTKGSTRAGDISTMRTEALKSACSAFGLPYSLLSGEVAGTAEAWELATASVLNPFRQIIETEMNGKLYGADVLQGDFLRGDITRIKPVNIFANADNIYKLIGSGYTHNEIRERAGDDTAKDKEADQRFFTKNNEQMGGVNEDDES